VTRSKWWWLLDIAAVVPLVAMVLSITIAAIPAYRIATNPQTAVGVVTAKRANLPAIRRALSWGTASQRRRVASTAERRV
jgi:hypothetical protein